MIILALFLDFYHHTGSLAGWWFITTVSSTLCVRGCSGYVKTGFRNS